MHQDTPLIATIAVRLVLAFVFGALAIRLRLSPLVGYLIAGIAVTEHGVDLVIMGEREIARGIISRLGLVPT